MYPTHGVSEVFKGFGSWKYGLTFVGQQFQKKSSPSSSSNNLTSFCFSASSLVTEVALS